ncbi:hypothetical protein ATO3_10900 [Marinibacterium profundimaris]|uniref:Uncharacterized protein n=1 Tax=Marinibacterium profundimaris TaxID=1679460 RepID=A0A225NLG7_9RHOB|nr:hypothetical protein ATO3_10900 [Marinibacterium profundimaris]
MVNCGSFRALAPGSQRRDGTKPAFTMPRSGGPATRRGQGRVPRESPATAKVVRAAGRRG